MCSLGVAAPVLSHSATSSRCAPAEAPVSSTQMCIPQKYLHGILIPAWEAGRGNILYLAFHFPGQRFCPSPTDRCSSAPGWGRRWVCNAWRGSGRICVRVNRKRMRRISLSDLFKVERQHPFWQLQQRKIISLVEQEISEGQRPH